MRFGGVWAGPNLAAIAAVLALGGCGGESDDREAVITTLDRAITSTDPAYCTDAVTQAYLEQAQGVIGPTALGGCVENATDEVARADEIEVDEVAEGDKTARATITARGGNLDGSTVVLSLIKVDGDWRVNRVEDFVHLERDALLIGLRREFMETPSRFSGGAEDCVVDGFNAIPERRLETIYLSGSRTELDRLLVDCDRPAFTGLMVRAFRESNLPEVTACARRRLSRMSDATLAGLGHDPVGVAALAIRCDREAFLDLLQTQIERASGSPSAEASLCVQRALRKTPDSELARIQVDPAILGRIAAGCGLDADVPLS
jgi:hypothetical protein